MECETCGREVEGICEKLRMTKKEKLAFELGYEKAREVIVFYTIIGMIIGF